MAWTGWIWNKFIFITSSFLSFCSFIIPLWISNRSSMVQPFLNGGQINGDVCDFAVDEFACASVSDRNLSLTTCWCVKWLNAGLQHSVSITGLLSCHRTAVGFGCKHISRFPGLQSLHDQRQHVASLEASPVQSFICVGWSSWPFVQQGENHSSAPNSCFQKNEDTDFLLYFPSRVWTPGALQLQWFWKRY